MNFIIPCLVAFVLTTILTPPVIRLARACRCLDIPGKRRVHKKITPRWGGMAFFAGVLPILFFADAGRVMTSYIAASFLLVGIGIVDDRKELGWKIKLAGIAAAATMVIFGGNVVVRDIGAYGPLGRMDLGGFSIPLTYLGIIGVTNAVNLLDGLNGLAGGVSLLGFLFMGTAAALAGNVPLALICFAFVGALGAFLRYNFPDARIFMGDSGSMFLGFSLSITAVLLTQDARFPVEPMFPVLALLLPIFDTLRVMSVRLLSGKNPFHADKTHLHHLIVRKKISPVHAVLFLWSLTAVFGGIALILAERTAAPYLAVALSATLLLGLFAESLTWRRQARWAARWETYLRRLRPRWTRGIHPAQAGGGPVREAAGGAGIEPPAAASLTLLQKFQFQRRSRMSKDHHGLHGLRGERSGHLFISAPHHQPRRPVYGQRFHNKADHSLHPDTEVW